MNLLGDQFEGRIVIATSGHKSENTVKQYIRQIPAAKKREVSQHLADNILPKKPKPNESISKPPENPENAVIEIQLDQENITPPADNMQFQLEVLDDAPPDEVLSNFLAQFDPPVQPSSPQQNLNPPQVLNPVPLVPNQIANNTMNIKNVHNVNPNQLVPAMVFPNSNVTINYNFGK